MKNEIKMKSLGQFRKLDFLWVLPSLVTPLHCEAQSMSMFEDDYSVASVPWGCFWMTPEDTRNTHTAAIVNRSNVVAYYICLVSLFMTMSLITESRSYGDD